MAQPGEVIHSLCFGTFPTSYINIYLYGENMNFQKMLSAKKLRKTYFDYAIIHHHLMQWFSLFKLIALLTNNSV